MRTHDDVQVEAFQAWLESHSPDTTVGYAWEAQRCPIAMWLREEWEVLWVLVSEEEITVGEEGYIVLRSMVSPAWVHDYVPLLDERSVNGEAVQAEKALDTLTHIRTMYGERS